MEHNLIANGYLDFEFEYPPEFIHILDLGISNIEPWVILTGDQLISRLRGIKNRYPSRTLVPFARRIDNDDIACWDGSNTTKKVAIIHDFATPGWEDKAEFDDFNSWFREAIDDLIEYEYDSGIIVD